jgi:hypothetical protein
MDRKRESVCVKISRAGRHRKGRCLCYQDRKKRVEKKEREIIGE